MEVQILQLFSWKISSLPQVLPHDYLKVLLLHQSPRPRTLCLSLQVPTQTIEVKIVRLNFGLLLKGFPGKQVLTRQHSRQKGERHAERKERSGFNVPYPVSCHPLRGVGLRIRLKPKSGTGVGVIGQGRVDLGY